MIMICFRRFFVYFVYCFLANRIGILISPIEGFIFLSMSPITLYIYIYIYIYTYIYICVCMYVCMYVCECVFLNNTISIIIRIKRM